MQYRDFGNTGIKVSALGFGAMRLEMDGDHVDFDKSGEAIARAFDLGVNYIDSAVGYCKNESEIAVGKALKGRRDKVYVSTKNPDRSGDAVEWRKLLDQSLERMDIDYLDFYNFHGLRWNNYVDVLSKPGGPMDEMRKAHDEGIVKHMCFSCHDTVGNIRKMIDLDLFAGMTVQYNLLDRHNEEVIAYAHEKGMGVVIMGPLAGGSLAMVTPQLQEMLPESIASTPELALRFVLANPNVSLAISGMNAVDMVEENCRTAARTEELSPEELDNIMAAANECYRLSQLYCTGCEYCMPCPQNVAIADMLRLMNYHRIYGLTKYAQNRYAMYKTWDLKKDASACIECGECEEKCPQNIEIVKQLKETRGALEVK
ncbi:aldo/keto reductase [Candidatus Hydrogenedentota bacterium]